MFHPITHTYKQIISFPLHNMSAMLYQMPISQKSRTGAEQ